MEIETILKNAARELRDMGESAAADRMDKQATIIAAASAVGTGEKHPETTDARG